MTIHHFLLVFLRLSRIVSEIVNVEERAIEILVRSHSPREKLRKIVHRCNLQTWRYLFAADSMGLSSITSTQRAPEKAIYGISHSRSSNSVPIEIPYATSY